MNKRELLKSLLKGNATIPAITPGRLLIATSQNEFTDSLTGERFTRQQVNQMREPFAGNQPEIWQIVTSDSGLIQDDDLHPAARKPHYTPTKINGVACFQFEVVFIPEVTPENQLFYATLKNQ